MERGLVKVFDEENLMRRTRNFIFVEREYSERTCFSERNLKDEILLTYL